MLFSTSLGPIRNVYNYAPSVVYLLHEGKPLIFIKILVMHAGEITTPNIRIYSLSNHVVVVIIPFV